MNKFESMDQMLDYISNNTDKILKNVDYAESDLEGEKSSLTLETLQELLDEMVDEGSLKITGKSKDGEDLYLSTNDSDGPERGSSSYDIS